MIARRAIVPCIALWVLTGPASAVRSDWTDVGEAQVRLLAASGEPGSVAAGVEIALDPGWYTYWRNPGDAGIPPTFDFSASVNVAAAEVHYPAPQRYSDGASTSLIYTDQVVFPVTVTPLDKGQPVRLRLQAAFGVCREICIPAEAQAELTVPVKATADALTKGALARSAARLPGKPRPGEFDVENAALSGPDEITLTVRMPDSAYADLFVDGPAGWSTGQPELVARDGSLAHYRVSLAGRPNGASASGQQFRFVAVAGSEAIEEVIQIP